MALFPLRQALSGVQGGTAAQCSSQRGAARQRTKDSWISIGLAPYRQDRTEPSGIQLRFRSQACASVPLDRTVAGTGAGVGKESPHWGGVENAPGSTRTASF